MNNKNDEDIIKRSFQSWKIIIAILLGVGIAAWMMYHSLQKPYFVEDTQHGTHVWVDANHDGKIEASNQKEFQISNHGDYRQQRITDLLKEIDWTTGSFFLVFCAVCCMGGRDFFYMYRIRTLTKRDLTWRQSFNVIMLWEFASALSPGVVGGSTVAMFILNKEKIPLGRSTAIVFVTALLDNLFFLLTVPIIFMLIDVRTLFSEGQMEADGIQLLFWLAYAGIFMTSLILAISIFFYPKLVKKLLAFVFKIPFLKRFEPKVIEIGNQIEETSHLMRQESWRFWFDSIWSTILSWISRYLVINFLIAAFVHINAFEHLIILGKQFLLWVIMMVSPTPGGSGIAEFAFGRLMTGLGVTSLLLAGLAILWRLISYFPYLFIGAFILPRWLQKK